LVVDVQQMRAMLEYSGRIAIDVAAVEHHDGALPDVLRGDLDRVLQRWAAVLARERQVACRDEHLRVLTERGQEAVHTDQRAERVAVGILVRGDDKASSLADPLQYEPACVLDRVGCAHRSPPSVSASIRASTRIARSVVSS